MYGFMRCSPKAAAARWTSFPQAKHDVSYLQEQLLDCFQVLGLISADLYHNVGKTSNQSVTNVQESAATAFSGIMSRVCKPGLSKEH